MLCRISFKGPVNDYSSAQHVLSGNKPPIPAVSTVVAIISHCKVVTGRYNDLVALHEILVVEVAVEDITILLVVCKPA